MVKRRQFWQIIMSSAALVIGCKKSQQLPQSDRNLAEIESNLSSSAASTKINVAVNWTKAIAKTTPLTFGSNDYEIIYPKRAADSKFQGLISQLNIPLIRVHHAELSEHWTDASLQTWDESKIKAGYDASYTHNPQIVQNIPRWASWMQQDAQGLLAPVEYESYARFCAELVAILNLKQNRNILLWEPFNELEPKYQDAGKLDELWQLYNLVARRMKQVDRRIKIGGPALTWDNTEILESFLHKCAHNVDFISWHRYASGDVNDSTAKIMAFTRQYGDQVRKFRSLVARYLPKRKVPLFLSEYNINYTWDSGETRQNTHIGAVWFASVLKHLAEADIDMATSWHLKDGIYGMIDPDNQLRPSATIFSWAIKFLSGTVMQTTSDRPWLEALAVQPSDRSYSLLLINKSSQATQVNLTETNIFSRGKTQINYLDVNGVKVDNLSNSNISSLPLKPYSVLLLHRD